MTSLDFIPYAKQSINEQDLLAVSQALQTTAITRGSLVDEFEKVIAEYCGASFAVAFNSGTAALYAACHAAEISAVDRLITTPNTFIATAGAGMQLGARPILVDIDRSSGNLNLQQLEMNLNHPLTRGRTVVMPVHFAGIAVDMRRLDGLINNPQTVVIEDAAHALGSLYPDGQRVGSCTWSQMTMFSFHPAKTITTGEGGMVTTNDPDLYHRLKRYRNNGIEREEERLQEPSGPWYYEVQEITNNFNFTTFQAALGLSQFKRLEQFVTKRRELLKAYRCHLRDIPGIQLFDEAHDDLTAYHLCVLQIDFSAFNTTRNEVMHQLHAQGIGTQVHYIPLYQHPVIKNKSGDISEYFPQMENYYQQAISMPLYYDLPIEKVAIIANKLKKALRIG